MTAFVYIEDFTKTEQDPNIRVKSIDLSLSANLKYVGNCVSM